MFSQMSIKRNLSRMRHNHSTVQPVLTANLRPQPIIYRIIHHHMFLTQDLAGKAIHITVQQQHEAAQQPHKAPQHTPQQPPQQPPAAPAAAAVPSPLRCCWSMTFPAGCLACIAAVETTLPSLVITSACCCC